MLFSQKEVYKNDCFQGTHIIKAETMVKYQTYEAYI